MCGLVAVMGRPNEKMLFMFELLLSISVLRGKDSTGMAAIEKNTSTVVKSVGWPLELMRSKEYKNKIIKGAQKTFCYIGHNRAATIGKITKENAHPFVYDDVILAHNGTLKEFITSPHKEKFNTDSQSITCAISEKGIDWTWEHLDGAASLIYYKKGKLYIITNGERPLFFATTKGNNLLLIASESWMIRNVCKRLNVKLKADKVYYPENDVLFSFAYNQKTEKITQSEGRDIKPFEKWGKFGFRKSAEPYKAPSHGTYLPPTLSFNKNKTPPDSSGSSILRIDGLTEEEFDKKYEYCALCAAELKWVEATVIDGDLAACGNCTTSEQLTQVRAEALLRGI